MPVQDRVEYAWLTPGAAQGLSEVEQAQDTQAKAEGMAVAAEARREALAESVSAGHSQPDEAAS